MLLTGSLGGGCGYGTHMFGCRKGILAFFCGAEGGLWVGTQSHRNYGQITGLTVFEFTILPVFNCDFYCDSTG